MTAPQVTIKDLADALGLAHTTVSRALNDHPQTNFETKQRVRAFALELGYVANAGARHMRNGSSKVIGLIVPDVQNEFYAAVARSLADQCAHSGFQLNLGISEDDSMREFSQVNALLESRARGLMIAPCGNIMGSTRALLAKIPHMQLLRYDEELGGPGITADDVGAIKSATEYLIGLGHSRIGFVGSSLSLSTGRARLQGYQEALIAAGIEANEKLVRVGAALPKFGYQAVQEMIESLYPTALMISSSRQLIGALQYMQSAGIAIPQSVSVIGYGDADWFGLVDPPITGVAMPVADMTSAATQQLFASLEAVANDQLVQQCGRHLTEFEPHLVLRRSTSFPRED